MGYYDVDSRLERWRKKLGEGGITSDNQFPPEKLYTITEEGYRALSENKETHFLERFKLPVLPTKIAKEYGDSEVLKINYFLKNNWIKEITPEGAILTYIDFIEKRTSKVEKEIMLNEVENFINFANVQKEKYHSTLQIELVKALKSLEGNIDNARVGYKRDKFIRIGLETISFISKESERRKGIEKISPLPIEKIERKEITHDELKKWEDTHKMEGELLTELKKLYELYEENKKKDDEHKNKIEELEIIYQQERNELLTQIKDKEKHVSMFIEEYNIPVNFKPLYLGLKKMV